MTGDSDSSRTSVDVLPRGRVPYTEALELQRRIHAERASGARRDAVLLLTHPPVVTLGRGSDDANLLLTPEEFERRGIEVIDTDRGGDVTYHGPGQLVGYPIVGLRERELGPRTFLRALEESLIRLLATYGVEGTRVPGLTGVWVGREKVAAMGIRVSRGVTMHGFALNVTTDPTEFEVIVPCGIADRSVTSLDRLVEEPVTVESVAKRYPPFLEAALAATA